MNTTVEIITLRQRIKAWFAHRKYHRQARIDNLRLRAKSNSLYTEFFSASPKRRKEIQKEYDNMIAECDEMWLEIGNNNGNDDQRRR